MDFAHGRLLVAELLPLGRIKTNLIKGTRRSD
jgi:hypothetical protein